MGMYRLINVAVVTLELFQTVACFRKFSGVEEKLWLEEGKREYVRE